MIRVSASAFDILWEDMGLASAPLPFDVRSVGATGAERGEVRETVYRNLGERGLCDGRQVDETLAGRLRVLAQADVYVECEVLPSMGDESPLRAVAAACGRRAVLAAQPSRTIGLSGIRDTEIWAAIVEVLPEFPAGPGFGVSVPASALSDGSERTAARDKQLQEMRAIRARPVLGAGQFSVRVRTDGGQVRRAGGLSWFTTDVGAYCGTVAPGRGGASWLTLTPVDPPRLAERLAEFAA